MLEGEIEIQLGADIIVTVPAEATATVTDLGGGQFEIENAPESAAPIVVEIQGQVLEFSPGESGVPAIFANFDIEEAEVELEGSDRDQFEVEGRFKLGATSNGIDVLNEDVEVTFDGFTQTIPAGSFFRDDERFRFNGAPGGITQFDIRDDGEFQVEARDLALSGIGSPVPFSLRIGDDRGNTEIPFDAEGEFEQ